METILTYAQENSSAGSGMSGFWWIIGAIGLWKMFEKAGTEGWAGLIPFYRQYKLCEKVMNDPWYWLRQFLVVVPIIGLFLYLYFSYQIGKATAKAYGQSEGWAWGYTFLPPIFYVITGFGDYSYYGPYGRGDQRNSDARQAKTVDFDVVRQEPANEAQVQPAGESEVEFDFNQDEITE